MPRNVYFSQGVRSEQDLYENIITEAIAIYGHEVWYLPRTLVNVDSILNEDIESKFSAAYMVDMYIENVDGFDGEGELFSKFGLEIRHQATFVVSKRKFEKLVSTWNNSLAGHRPKEGDLIYLPLTRALFEIKYVETKQPFYQLSNIPTYKLQCEMFESSNERIETGVNEVDQTGRNYSTEYVFDVESGNGTDFVIGEEVKQVFAPATLSTPAQEVYGTVLRFEENVAQPLKIYVGNLRTTTGKFDLFRVTTSTDKLIGVTSGAEWSITKIYDIDDANIDRTFVNNNQLAQNRDFELDADEIIDFSEKNPFGDPSDNN